MKICFIRVLDGDYFVIVSCHNEPRYKKGWKTADVNHGNDHICNFSDMGMGIDHPTYDDTHLLQMTTDDVNMNGINMWLKEVLLVVLEWM